MRNPKVQFYLLFRLHVLWAYIKATPDCRNSLHVYLASQCLRFFIFQYCDHFRRSYDEIPHRRVLHVSHEKVGIIITLLHGNFIKDDTSWYKGMNSPEIMARITRTVAESSLLERSAATSTFVSTTAQHFISQPPFWIFSLLGLQRSLH